MQTAITPSEIGPKAPSGRFVQLAGLISELSGIWSNDSDFRASLEVICRFGRRMLEADGACVLVSEGERLRVVAASGDGAAQWEDRLLAPSELAPAVARAIQFQRPETASAAGDGLLFGDQALLAEPILTGERALGAVVFLRASTRRPFVSADEEQGALLAGQASFAYRMRRRTHELELIYEVTRRINSTLKLEEVLESIYQGISRILPTDNFYIAFYDQESNQIRFEVEVEGRQRLAKRSRPHAQGLTEYLLATRRPLLINHNFLATCEALGIRFGGRAACCWMGAPMVFRDQAVGVIALQSYEQEGLFDQDHVCVLENVASQAAVAIENARLYQQACASFQQLQATQQLLLQSEKLAAVGQLISGIAHELNNPLTGVVGWTQYLMNQPLGERVRRHLTTINEQAQRASKIVQNLLTFSRQHKPEQCPVEINDILESTLALRAYELRVNNIGVRRALAEDLPLIFADPHQLQQVILNLIINAEQAILSVRRSGTISIATQASGRSVRVTVADDGPGIPPELLEQIFDPFFTTKPIGQGTGLGLSISFGIVQEHGGRIWAQSEPGGGARFLLELPVTEARAAQKGQEASATTVSPAARKILIVDDEESVRELLQAVLEDEPVVIETAATGEEALGKATRAWFDLIVTDLKMPGLSGAQFCEKLRATQPAPTPQFLFVTGDVLSAETQQFLQSTRSLCMLKPFDITQARRTILNALNDTQARGNALNDTQARGKGMLSAECFP